MNELQEEKIQSERPRKTKEDYFCRKVEDWDEVRSEFVYGYLDENGQRHYPSYKELAERYGVSVKTVYNKSYQDQWATIKSITQQKLKERRRAQELRQLVTESASYDSQALEAIDKLYKIIHGQLQRYQGCSEGEEELPTADYREIKALTESVDKLVTMTRRILGEQENIDNIAEELKQLRKEEKGSGQRSEKLEQLQHQLSELKRARKSLNERRNSSLTRVK